MDATTIIAVIAALGGGAFIPKLMDTLKGRVDTVDAREARQHEWEEKVRLELDARLEAMDRKHDECQERNAILLFEVQKQTLLIQEQSQQIKALKQEVDELRDALAQRQESPR